MRFELPDGRALDVVSPCGQVSFANGAFELFGVFGAEDGAIELAIEHPIVNPRHVWVPHLAPAEGYVMGDAIFRSPAIVLADGALALAFVPDLDDVAGAAGYRVWLDYEHPRRTVTMAAGAYREEGHVFYVREPARAAGCTVALRLHLLASCDPRDCANPYGMVARWMWNRWGRSGLMPPADLTPLLRHIVRWAFAPDGWTESVWQRIDDTTAAPVFIVDVSRHPSVPREQRRWREPRSIWNQAWFSTQRCANGLLRYARQTGSADLEDRARRMTEVALAAPQRDGLFPSRIVADEASGTWRWSHSDRRPPSASEEACHLVDAAFTGRMLLEWHALTGDARARDRVLRLAERLVALQRPSGAFPGWVEPDGRSPTELAEGPESAVSVALLLELARATGDAAWEKAALATLPFLEEVAREGRWEDFETYYSCAPWGAPELLGQRVPRNGVYKQNTLSIAWCASAFFEAWQTTRDARYLDLARRCIDELSLYQAVWNPPFLPAPAHGGFGVMNADSEWNDARQSLFAPLYLELGRATGDRELTERGISALHASFSMLYCPENAALARAYEKRFPFFGPETYGFMMENQAHAGADPIGTFTIFTWGNGSALATAATVRDRFPEWRTECGLP
ncbi:hypothetical protein LVJ94_28035 [Pendulispora rubella]|uniref:Uncharacterized protein n=1 Tax=Pendulispora rubella TaxID=2741070 RepID=A0ABZ2KST4_9BACT